jgi:hypothetical protein
MTRGRESSGIGVFNNTKTGGSSCNSLCCPPNSNNTVLALNELDSHADTCALGSNFVPLHYTGRVCDVSPYNSTYDPERDVPIVTGATAYTDQHTGQVFISVINEALWFGDRLSNFLINSNQLRYAGVLVQDNPLNTSEPIAIKHEEVNEPLILDGTNNLFFQTTTPHSRNSTLAHTSN